jgi:hypothetical protein
MAMNDTDERCITRRQDAAARIVAAAEGFVLHDVRVQSALTCSRHHHVRARIYLPTDDAITETLPDGVRIGPAPASNSGRRESRIH